MSSLLSNRTNLLSRINSFINENDAIIIYSAYIKDDILNDLISHSEGQIKQVIVRWKAKDLMTKSSDLEVFETCQRHNIILYRNINLHAKCIVNGKGDCILGSANITNNGLLNSAQSNWEINTEVKQIDKDSRVILNQILLESELVTKEWVDDVGLLIGNNVGNEDDIELPLLESSHFLLSSLPMCNHPELLWEIFYDHRQVPIEELESAAHDVALFQMSNKQFDNKEAFLHNLKEAFNSHPFVSKLLAFIRSEESCRYGTIVRWIQNNCIEVPIPRSWEVKQKLIVNILYDWICYFNQDFAYIRKYPKGSDIITFNSK